MHKPVKVDAIQLKRPTTIQIDEETTMDGVAGDWLVISDSGEQAVMEDVKFKTLYTPFAEKPTRPEPQKDIIKITKGVPLERNWADEELRPPFPVAPSKSTYELDPTRQSIRDLLEETDDDILLSRLQEIQKRKTAEKQAAPPAKKKGFFSFGKKKTRRPSNDEFKGDNIQIV